MKSAIEEHGLITTIYRWWAFSNNDAYDKSACEHWLHGASCVHGNEFVREELYFLSEIVHQKRMLP